MTFHAGYLYSSLKEVEFDQVRTIAGADLFQQVHNPQSVNTYAAFLSYQLLSGNMGRHGAACSRRLAPTSRNRVRGCMSEGSVKFLSRVYVGRGRRLIETCRKASILSSSRSEAGWAARELLRR